MDVRNVVERAVWTVVQAAAAAGLVFVSDLSAQVEGVSVVTVAVIAAVAGVLSAVKTAAQEKLRG